MKNYKVTGYFNPQKELFFDTYNDANEYTKKENNINLKIVKL